MSCIWQMKQMEARCQAKSEAVVSMCVQDDGGGIEAYRDSSQLVERIICGLLGCVAKHHIRGQIVFIIVRVAQT